MTAHHASFIELNNGEPSVVEKKEQTDARQALFTASVLLFACA